jgi:hypothetical protein
MLDIGVVLARGNNAVTADDAPFVIEFIAVVQDSPGDLYGADADSAWG